MPVVRMRRTHVVLRGAGGEGANENPAMSATPAALTRAEVAALVLILPHISKLWAYGE